MQKNKHYDLLKFPIATLSILITLLLAKWLLNFDLAMIEEIGTGGVRFRERQVEAISDLDTRLNDLAMQLSVLDSAILQQQEQKKIIVTEETAQTSEATALLVKANLEGEQTIIKGKEGYIWIGNYDPDSQKWENQQLLRLDSSQLVEAPPGLIGAGSKYRVAGNMVIRQGLPKNDIEYFRGQSSIGTVPRGTSVEILEKPIGIDREFAIQYWVKIKVAE